MTEKRLFNAHELAEVLDLSADTVLRFIKEKRIPHVEVGPGQYRYFKGDVLQALKKGSAGPLQEELADYKISGQLTYADYAKLPNEAGYTLQLIDGCIIRDPSPTFLHQRISGRLQSILRDYFLQFDPGGEVFDAPLDVLLSEHTVLQPDLLYLPSSRPAQRDPVDSLPELVVEIVSPTTARTDRIRKLSSYQKAKVPHYWIVDPKDCFIECYALRSDGHYALITTCGEGTFTHPSFPGLAFELAELFAEV